MDIKKMKQEMEEELVSNILPFWINRMTDEVNGGFYGRITGREEVKPEAEKGAILNARILWILLGCIPLAEEAGVSGNGYACQTYSYQPFL